MNAPFPSRGQVEYTRSCYLPGTRIMLNNMNDPYTPVPAGTRGTVRYVDNAGQIGVAWDNGRSLSLIPGVDSFRKLTQQEIAQEQAMTIPTGSDVPGGNRDNGKLRGIQTVVFKSICRLSDYGRNHGR